MVQKSGYFSRSAPAGERDLALIREMTDLAVDCGLRGEAGVIGHDEDRGGELRAIELDRIADSCGYSVPVMDFVADRDLLDRAHERRAPEYFEQYAVTRNAASIDDLPGLAAVTDSR